MSLQKKEKSFLKVLFVNDDANYKSHSILKCSNGRFKFLLILACYIEYSLKYSSFSIVKTMNQV